VRKRFFNVAEMAKGTKILFDNVEFCSGR